MLRLADDITPLANTEKEIEEALNVTETVYKYIVGETKVIASRTKPGKKRPNIKIGNEKIGVISEFFYLGSKITMDARCDAVIHSRKRQAKKASTKLPQLLVLNIDLDIRKKLP